MEGRDLSSRQTQDVVRDLEIGQPINSEECSETADRSLLAIIAHAIRAILLASAMAATFVGRRVSNAVSQGRCLVPWILA